MNWSWNEAEDAALDYLPHQAQVLYLRVLRTRMDFASGVVGLTARLSYVLIAEWLEVRPEVRSTSKLVRLTVGQIRAALTQLERRGLIERVCDDAGNVLPLVFRLPLARSGIIRHKYEQQMSNSKNNVCATAISDDDKKIIASLFRPDNTSLCGVVGAVDNRPKELHKIAMNDSKKDVAFFDEQHTSGVGMGKVFNNNIYTLPSRNADASLLPVNWLPGVAMVERLVLEFGLPPAFIFSKAVELSVLWREQAKAVVDWDGYFYGTCRNQIENGREDFIRAINQKKSEGSV